MRLGESDFETTSRGPFQRNGSSVSRLNTDRFSFRSQITVSARAALSAHRRIHKPFWLELRTPGHRAPFPGSTIAWVQ